MLAFLFSPSGRIGRRKWWLAQLVIICIIISLMVILGLQFSGDKIIEQLSDRSNPRIDPMFALELLVFALFLVDKI